MAGWIADGRLRSVEDVVTGLESLPRTLLLKLYRG